jgi:hypothetical protein
MLISNGLSFASIDKQWARLRIAITADGRQRDADTLTAYPLVDP